MLQICPLGLVVFEHKYSYVLRNRSFWQKWSVQGPRKVAERYRLCELSDITAIKVFLGRFMPASRLTGSDLA